MYCVSDFDAVFDAAGESDSIQMVNTNKTTGRNYLKILGPVLQSLFTIRND